MKFAKLSPLSFLCFFLLFGCNQNVDSLYKKVDNNISNIDFINNIVPNKDLNAFTFTNFYNGGGVGIGDFNKDGLPDVVFTANQEKNKIYLNKGNLVFEDITETAGINIDQSWNTGVSIIDINQDGWDDIYISTAFHHSLSNTKNLLFINQKTDRPTFKEEAKKYNLDFDGFTTQTAFFDYDLDGDLDAFLLNTAPDFQNPNYLRPSINTGIYPSTDKLFRNEINNPNAESPFVEVSKEAGILFEGLGLGLSISDVNMDGYPDIYCSNDFQSSDILYLNNGDGTFTNTIKSSFGHTSKYGMGIDAADINNDMLVDIMQLDMLPEGNERQKQMISNQNYDKTETSISERFGYQLQYMRNSLQVNQGNNSKLPVFSEIGLLAGIAKTDWSWSTLLTDLDNDGQKDVFITNGYRKNVTDLDFISYNKTNNIFGSDETRAANREDLINKVPEIKLRNYAYKNLSNLSFKDVSQEWGLDELSYANGSVYCDLDLDGDLDLLVNNIDEKASLFENTGNEKTFLNFSFEGEKDNKQGIGVKLTVWTKNNTQFFENYPVRGFQSSVDKSIHVGLDESPSVDSLAVLWPNGKVEKRYNIPTNQFLKIKELNAKQQIKHKTYLERPLFEEIPSPVVYTHKESNFIDFNHTASLHKMLSKSGPTISQGDFNGDGLEDFILGGSYQGSLTNIFLQSKNSSFSEPIILNTKNMEVGSILVFDADLDGDEDLLITGTGNERPLAITDAYQPLLFLNDGKAQFTLSKNFPKISVSSQKAVKIDFDNDGDFDVIIAGRQIPNEYPLSPKSYILKNENGIFSDATELIAPDLSQIGMISDIAVFDFDGDKDDDFVVVGEWMNCILFESKNGSFQKTKSNIAPQGWWNTIQKGDFDNDGDIDLLLGNEGLNTTFRASEKQPIKIYAKDFNNDGILDPIMGHYLKDQEVPFLPLGSLSKQIVQFRKRYTLYSDYAKADFNDLLSAIDLKNSFYAEVKELKSCYAENLGNGNFKLSQLPILTQQSPISSFIVQDFDFDGHLDAISTGNFYPNEANTGRQDASFGLFLKGNGDGTFMPLNSIKSGLFIKGDARRSIYLNQSKTLITSINSATPVFHRLLKQN
ncbi:VCBS repeat-containing protein [uncultured Arcticibacterium sp.]|uniref:VCBS repeat-containing protein n=1 Tax=uncultured Arcticibacterium sp. TaxID=2173042 RepID=UPI0030F5D4B0